MSHPAGNCCRVIRAEAFCRDSLWATVCPPETGLNCHLVAGDCDCLQGCIRHFNGLLSERSRSHNENCRASERRRDFACWFYFRAPIPLAVLHRNFQNGFTRVCEASGFCHAISRQKKASLFQEVKEVQFCVVLMLSCGSRRQRPCFLVTSVEENIGLLTARGEHLTICGEIQNL